MREFNVNILPRKPVEPTTTAYIEAVKAVRIITGLGLYESKLLIDQNFGSTPPTVLEFAQLCRAYLESIR